ncbi:MAG: DNA damage-inducible protein F [Candidatus Erwinia impunctatus]|nr:DNA damage-inducible protein F [Culicoides impunctatus]
MRWLTQADKQLWRLALPMILSNITVPLLGSVDTAIIGHLDSPRYLAGVAIGTTITSFAFMLLLFLRMSTTGLTAQAWGARNRQAIARSLVQPLLIALIAGGLFILFRTPLSQLALEVVGTQEDVAQQALLFLNIRWLSSPATLANLVILGWLLGVQYARAPVILLVVGNTVNIALDVLFVFGLGWGVEGAAAATVIAEYTTLLVGFFIIWRVLLQRGISLSQLKHAWRGELSSLLRLNRDIFLRSLLLQLCFFYLMKFGAQLGSEVVAVNAILLMFLTFTAYALDGFAYAVESCSGEAYGRRDSQHLISVWHAACRQAGLVAVAFALVYALAGPVIINRLTSLPELRTLAVHYLAWQVILPLCGVWCYLLDGMFVGATRASDMRNSMICAALGFALTLCTLPVLGNHGLWLAMTVFLLLRGLTLWLIWRYHWRHNSWFICR